MPNRPVNERSRRTRIFLISEHAIYRAGSVACSSASGISRWSAPPRTGRRRSKASRSAGPMRPSSTSARWSCRTARRCDDSRPSRAPREFSSWRRTSRSRRFPRSCAAASADVATDATPLELFIKSIRTVASGRYWVGEKAVDDVVATVARAPAGSSPGGGDGIRLTRREMDVVSLVMSGCPNKRIADECAIGQRTVKHHLTNVFGKLGVSNRLSWCSSPSSMQLVVTSHAAATRRLPAAIGPSSDRGVIVGLKGHSQRHGKATSLRQMYCC